MQIDYYTGEHKCKRCEGWFFPEPEKFRGASYCEQCRKEISEEEENYD